MQTICFLPDRLNAEPAVFRDFTLPEMELATLIGLAVRDMWYVCRLFNGWLGHHPHRNAAHAAATLCFWRALDGSP